MTLKLFLYILTGCAGAAGITTYIVTVDRSVEVQAVEADQKFLHHIEQKDTGNRKVGLR
jgi:uncharacterized protein YcfL